MAHILATKKDPLSLRIPTEELTNLAQRTKQRRLDLGLTQEGLAKRAGISLGSLKRFERSGKIALESLLKIALPLQSLDDFEKLFSRREDTHRSLDEILKEPRLRKRGSIS